jgi:hypothetical protein
MWRTTGKPGRKKRVGPLAWAGAPVQLHCYGAFFVAKKKEKSVYRKGIRYRGTR